MGTVSLASSDFAGCKSAEFSAGSFTRWMELRYLTSLGCSQHLFRAAGQIESVICYIHLGPINRIQIHRRYWHKIPKSVRMVFLDVKPNVLRKS